MSNLTMINQLTRSMINEITGGYGGMVAQKLEAGWEGYLITFMFNRLRGYRQSVRIQQMHKEVERVYATVLTRIVREPSKVPIRALPLWIVCPDYPVPKHEKQSLRDITLNNGLHCHGIALIPPGSRMNCGLDQHFEMHQELYVRRGWELARVHAVPITDNPRYVVEYGFKAIQRGRLDFGHVLILPRSHSEMPAKPRRDRAGVGHPRSVSG